MYITGFVLPLWLVCDLNENISRDTTLLTHLPSNGLHVVILLPNTLQQCRHDVVVLLDGIKGDASGETKVIDIVGECLDVIEGQLRLTEFTAGSPVVT